MITRTENNTNIDNGIYILFRSNMRIYKTEIEMDYNNSSSIRSCKIILVIVIMFCVDSRFAAEFESCPLSQGGKECTVGKEICCLCRQNVTERNLAGPDLSHGVNNNTTKCKMKLNEDCKLIICPLLKKGQIDKSASMELNNLLCNNEQTAEMITCNVCCTVVEPSEEYNSGESAHDLSESAKVAIICSAFGFIVVLFVVYMSYRRRADHIYGVIFINNSEPFVSLLSRQTAINASTRITDV